MQYLSVVTLLGEAGKGPQPNWDRFVFAKKVLVVLWLVDILA